MVFFLLRWKQFVTLFKTVRKD
uniref:Uncharacterized protein n=1 Tax=Triticum urartu TaxID=4572 RepID=A0A8R7V3T9_TRIUA